MAICLSGVKELWLDRQLGFEPSAARPPGGEECRTFPVLRLNPAVILRSNGNQGKRQSVLGILRKIQFLPQTEHRVFLLERPISECNIRKYWLFTEILTIRRYLDILRKIQFLPQREHRVFLLERPITECNIRKYWLFTEILTINRHLDILRKIQFLPQREHSVSIRKTNQ